MKKRYLLPLILVAAVALSLCAACTGEKKNTATLDKTEFTLSIGGSETLSLVWESGEGNETAEYSWKSSDDTIVTVTAEGETATVTAVAEGTAVVTVYEGEKELASCNVTVVTSPLSFATTVPEGKLVVRNGQTVTVRVTSMIALDEEGYEWFVSDPAYATVEYQGSLAMITAKKRGECTITVQNGVYTASFQFVVGLS